MRSRFDRAERRGELGAVSAEFVTAVPAAMLVVALCIAAVGAVATQVELESRAAQSARAAARGESPSDYARGARITVASEGSLVCVTLSRSALAGTLTLSARSCADARGW